MADPSQISGSMVPVYDPQGTLRDVPAEMLPDAVKAGGVPAHPVQAPDGKVRMVPVTRLSEAKQAGGTILPLEAPEHEIPKLYGFTLGNIASNAWQGAKSVVSGVADIGKDLATNPNWILGDKSTFQKFITDPAGAEAQKASEAFRKGRYSEAAGHELAGIVPMIGPAAAQIGEQAGTGDIGGAAAKGAAQALTPVAVARTAGPAVGMVSDAAKRALLLGKTPEAAYESALKPSTTIPAPKRAAMVKTGLQEGIPVSKVGLEKLADGIDALQQAVSDRIQAGAGKGVTVDPHKVASKLADTAQQFSQQVNPDADINAIANAGNEFLRNNPGPIPADRAQAMKVGTYRQLSSKAYGEMQTATKEAQKTLARGIKEELAAQIPEIGDLNSADGKLLDLQPILERAVNRISNHQLVGIGTPVAAGAAKVVTGSTKVGAVVGFMKAIVDDPAVKSRLAIAISKRKNVPLSAARARIESYSQSLAGVAAGGDQSGN